jgi:alcohol dehydrogenase (NADP+)
MRTSTLPRNTGIYRKDENAFTVKAYGATGSLIGGKKLGPMDIKRNPTGPDEVMIEVLYCGVCHSDLHQVENDWKNTIYPCVPGHEIIGRITEVGMDVTRFQAGDIVGVGCMIDSCRQCESCQEGEEQHCLGKNGPTMTYNGYFTPDESKFNTYGGYSTHVIAKEAFVLEIPGSLDLAAAAPILCAGVTTYVPLKYWDVQEGDRVGIVGIGGLGHMAVMIAKAMGAVVVAITTSEDKRVQAYELGADEVLVSEDDEEMTRNSVSLDFILCTIPTPFDVNQYVKLLRPRGCLVTVGLLGDYKSATDNMEVARLSRTIGGSLIGGIADTQEVLDFCADNNIVPQVQLINIEDVNDAFEKLKDRDVHFRYVIDMKSLSADKT